MDTRSPGSTTLSSLPRTAGSWTADSMHRYVAALEPGARTVLATILRAAPCPTGGVREATGLSGPGYAEAHISLEEALLMVPPPPSPVRLPFDVVGGCFTVDDEGAMLAWQELDRLDHEG